MLQIKHIYSKIAILVGGAIFLLGSASCLNKEVGEFSCSDLNKTFFVKPVKVQVEEFDKYDVEKQYGIFICGEQAHRPPAMYLAVAFAQRGSKIVGFLKNKLIKANDDLTIRDIIQVFALMEIDKSYDVADDIELMSLIHEKAKGMKDSFWRQTTERSLKTSGLLHN